MAPQVLERTPEALRSRVFGTCNAVAFVAAPLGTIFFGAVAQGHGVSVALGLIWLVWLGIGATVWLAPVFRLLDAPQGWDLPNNGEASPALAASLSSGGE